MVFDSRYVSTNVLIFVNEVPAGWQRVAARRYMQPIKDLGDAMLNMSLVSMVVAVCCMGWGCSYNCRGGCTLLGALPTV